ncbi:MAG: Beta-monoglucosyldiacylglycerol synthase [Planctomycetes bacterium ADurb.Bin126]|nr:MAG: Beta-monoglucosyldiacylglycerol synthase [Planctomycetes bacterium ADurb.Bin126]HQL75802.1 glycosyltransferase family 2 protein [Phycisphaerae bacterium]
MDWSDIAHTLFMTVYTFTLVMVALYGLHRWSLVYLYYRHRRKAPQAAGRFEDLPRVTIQLPMYNEAAVAERIIRKTCEIEYPRQKLQIQVLDDSTDETVAIAARAVDEARARGFDIEYIHRTDRTGFKAGALENGLKTATGEFVTIFDADFIPEPEILQRSIHYFTDPDVCVVQTRWEHLNRYDSMLTRSQAIFLDGHFAIEHVARNRSQRFMSFNGTAGTWRKSAIADAGGWQHDTLTEDLDLSYRAQLRGWKFVFLPDLTAPAELPPEMQAFKVQQFRWTKGGAQVALKLLPKVLLSKAPLKVKVEAFFHLTCFMLHLFMLGLVLMIYPAMVIQSVPLESGTLWRGMFDLWIFSAATLSASVFYVASQYVLFNDWRTAVKYLPVLMAIGVGLCVSNTKAILEALLGKSSEFVRTPKYGDSKTQQADGLRKRRRDLLPYVEFALGLYMTTCAILSLMHFQSMMAAPFLVIFSFGFFYVSVLSFQAQRARRTAAEQAVALRERA